MLPPLPRRSVWAYRFARSPSRISLPQKGHRVGLRIVLFEACSAFTRVTACTLALSPIRDTHPEGFSYFVTSIAAPVASGWSVRRVGLAPTGKRRLSTAHTHSCPLRECRVVRVRAATHWRAHAAPWSITSSSESAVQTPIGTWRTAPLGQHLGQDTQNARQVWQHLDLYFGATADEKTMAALLSCLRAGARRIRSATFPSARHVDYRFKDCPAFSIAVSTSLRAQPVNCTRLAASLANLIG